MRRWSGRRRIAARCGDASETGSAGPRGAGACDAIRRHKESPVPLMSLMLAAASATAPVATPAAIDAATRTAIEATCFDYVDGQLEGDPERVARALHPDLAKRRVL